MEFQFKEAIANLRYPSSVLFVPGSDPKRSQEVHLYLHGYGENAEVFAKRVRRFYQDKELAVDSYFINGPFPIPTIKNDMVLYQFAWYFYNPIENKYYIDFQTPVDYIKNVANQFNAIEEKALTIIGYSQGGYLAPFLGSAFENTERVISINASIREDMLPTELTYHLHQIHAEKDEQVDYDLAKKRFDLLKDRTLSSEWISVPKEKHYLSEEMLAALVKIIQ